MNHRVFVACVLSLVPLSFLGQMSPASAESMPCITYSIVGTLSEDREVAARLHLDDEPLVGHQVFAVFSGTDAEYPPTVLVTGPDGIATVALPDGATAVSFAAESPISGPCSSGDASDVVVVSDTVEQPGSEVTEPFSATDPAWPLAVTGPTSLVLPAAAVLALVAGWFVRRLRGADRPRTVAAACPVPRIVR